ncbi:hypothetical protein [Mesorhizobium sp.]|uniref:hypothetical protein n=1 Tax=Mesorhizobium sp. TaxID=1871066 RepID=UPI0025F387E0|nr:hypothetical protein [Mesorhizobium sp.]
MANVERNEVWFIAVVAATMGFLSGMVWMDTGHSAGRLERYQTLITGFLAVGAAFVTVNAMKRTDQEQRLRHAEQMEQAKRPERFARQRIVETYPAVFDYLASEAELVGRMMNEGTLDIDRPIVERVAKFCVRLHQIMKDESIRSARPFFDGSIEMNLNFLAYKDEEFEKDEYREFLKDLAISVLDGTLPDTESRDYFFRLCHAIQDMRRPLTALSIYFAAFADDQAFG